MGRTVDCANVFSCGIVISKTNPLYLKKVCMAYNLREENDFKYIEEGEGPVLLLLHGLFGALSNWVDVTSYFSPKYKVVIPLMPIYALPLLNTNVKALANFVHDFLLFKKYKDIVLIG